MAEPERLRRRHRIQLLLLKLKLKLKLMLLLAAESEPAKERASRKLPAHMPALEHHTTADMGCTLTASSMPPLQLLLLSFSSSPRLCCHVHAFGARAQLCLEQPTCLAHPGRTTTATAAAVESTTTTKRTAADGAKIEAAQTRTTAGAVTSDAQLESTRTTMTGETIADEGECTMTMRTRSKSVAVESAVSERGRETARAASAGGLARLREGTTLLDAARGAAGVMRKSAGDTTRDARESHHKAEMAAGALELKAAAMPALSFVAPRQVDLLAHCLRIKTHSEHRMASKVEKLAERRAAVKVDHARR